MRIDDGGEWKRTEENNNSMTTTSWFASSRPSNKHDCLQNHNFTINLDNPDCFDATLSPNKSE
jgi:hypothetical protein